jgi:peptidoglycan/xylan/chitin deacetylase (PgdA/CDA1 family)
VLTYHRVDGRTARPWLYPNLLSATPEGFEAQMASLRRRHPVVGLPELLESFRGRRALPPGAVLITVDDAYTDFRDNAWPILKALGLPVTLFVPTAFPDAPGRGFWWDRVWQAVTESRVGGGLETPRGPLPIRTEEERRSAARSLIELYKTLSHGAAMHHVDALCDRLEAAPSRSDVLGWGDLRLLRSEGVDLAAHTRTHPRLTRVPAEEVRAEVDGSRRDLEREIGDRAHSSVLAYPGGAHDARARRILSELGIALAFTTERGANRLGRTDPLRLRRINVGVRADVALIRAQISVATLREGIRRT